MAIFPRDSSHQSRKDAPATPSFAPSETPAVADFPNAQLPRAAAPTPTVRESVIANDLAIEGKIEGAGHVRIAGKFKGDVNVDGDLTIDQGALLQGGVNADRVMLAGTLEGNIHRADRVEVHSTGVMTGDIKAKTLIVAAGSRLRGTIDCGWDDQPAATASVTKASTPAPAATIATSSDGDAAGA